MARTQLARRADLAFNTFRAADAVAGSWGTFIGLLDIAVHKVTQHLLDVVEILEGLG